MNLVRLGDLDELVLNVRDKVSQNYIFESVSSYRAGAYRSAIISTWIAVSYDIITKIRELSVQGDKNAAAFITDLELHISHKNIPQLQKIEENILEKAKDDFEFLNQYEYEDLSRIKFDRNFCAHPAFVDKETLFQPTPELVRTHIVHSIIHLLQHQPIQGKAAINKVISDIKSLSFPEDYEKINIYLKDKYLNRAKDVLVKNLITVFVKHILQQNDPDLVNKQNKLLNCLISISRNKNKIYEEQMKDKLSSIVESVNDKKLWPIIYLLYVDSNSWDWLSSPNKIRITTFLENLTKDPYEIIENFDTLKHIRVPELQKSSVITLSKLETFIDSKIQDYSNSTSFRQAEILGVSNIIPFLPYFSLNNIVKLIKGIENNIHDQIIFAGGSPSIIEQIFDKTINFSVETKSNWLELQKHIKRKMSNYNSYRTLFKKIRKIGK